MVDSAPPSLAHFLAERVTTYEELELLLLLLREATPMTTAQLAERLGLPEASAEAAAEALCARGLIQLLGTPSDARYAYSPQNPFHEDVQRLAEAYRSERMSIVEIMAKNAMSRIRTAALRTFAEAFRIRGRKDGR